MTEPYNPIRRTFYTVRAALTARAGLPRRAIRPSARLDALIPEADRRRVWAALEEAGLHPPPLALPFRLVLLCFLTMVLGASALALALHTCWGLLAIAPLGLLAYRVSRPWAVDLPPGVETVGALVLSATPYAEHRQSGDRWTRHEIAYKVRLVIAESLGLPVDRVRPESTLAELDAR